MRLSALRKRLGDILVEVGIITPQQLKEALDIQKREGGKLGAILERMGVINEEIMLAFLGKQCGVSYISLVEYGEIPKDVLNCLPESIVRRQNLIPIAREGNTITVAMSDPFNIFAIDDIKLMTGYDVNVVIASESEIKFSIEEYYFHRTEFEEVLMSLSSFAESVNSPPKNGRSSGDLLTSLLEQTLEIGISDIYFEPQVDSVRIRYRINGLLQEHSHLSRDFMGTIFTPLKRVAKLDFAEKDNPQAGQITTTVKSQEINLRISVFPTALGEKLTMHISHAHALCFDLNNLGFEPEALSLYRKCIEGGGGLVLVTGPHQSGKTTTLYSTLSALNYPDRDILTIENDIEHVISGITQERINPAVGVTYRSLLEFHLPYHPDTVMLSDIPDQDTARQVFNASLSGHLIFSAFAAHSGAEALRRLSTMGIDSFLLSSALALLVHQNLLRRICPECREAYEVPTIQLRQLGIVSEEYATENKRATLWRGKGCPNCNYSGYHGRTGVFEVVRFDDELRRLINEHAFEAGLSRFVKQKGFIPLHESAWRKVQSGVTTIEEMLRLIKFSHESF